MATEMTAFIEYDLAPVQTDSGEETEPFSQSGTVVSLTGPGSSHDLATGSKNYSVFAALAGVRNEQDISPLIKPRGLPTLKSVTVKSAVLDSIFEDVSGTSWLYRDEIDAALAHAKILDEHISVELKILFDILSTIEKRLGRRRARLVFTFHP